MTISYFDKDWEWHFDNAIDWEKILPLYYPKYPTEEGLQNKEEVKEFLKELLQSTAQWAETSIKDLGITLDKKGAGIVKDGRTHDSEPIKKLIKEAKELMIFGLPISREFGGLETPNLIYMMFLNQTARSCLSSSTLLAFYISIGEMVHRYCDQETAERLIPQIVAGDISGSMNLTEPNAGSDLSMMKTSAEKQPDGSYLLNGGKIFITNGGGGLAFVLAKVKGDPDTLGGISMFFVEQEIEKEGEKVLNFKIDSAEKKMGLHGSFTTVVTYENTVGQLIGKQGEGFKYMLHLMNEARIMVSIQALGGLEGSIDYAKQYASERIAFGKPIAELPLLKRSLEDLETERDGIRALIADTMSWFDIYLRLDNKKVISNDLTKDEESLYKEASIWTRKRTPLLKYYSTEAYCHLSIKTVQVLGGYGFITEYPLERYHRDSFGPLLYEGTSQIQALMALKDLMKYAIKDPKKFISSIFFKHPSTTILNRENKWTKNFKSTHYRFKKKMMNLIIDKLKPDQLNKVLNPKEWTQESAIDELSIHAETLCEALSYMETLRVLCDHANKDESRNELFKKYYILVLPRLERIYKDWEIR